MVEYENIAVAVCPNGVTICLRHSTDDHAVLRGGVYYITLDGIADLKTPGEYWSADLRSMRYRFAEAVEQNTARKELSQ
jgi:hypothetical protein